MPVGIFVATPEQIEHEVGQGSSFIAVGTDMMYLLGGAAKTVNEGQKVAEKVVEMNLPSTVES